MTRLNMNEKANIISFDRELINGIVSKSIGKNLLKLLDSIKNIQVNDEVNNKVVKASDMLVNLTVELVKSETLEKKLKTRNRINYYIDKIKKLTGIENDNFYESLFLYRDDIKEYIRITKRNENINKIIRTNYSTLTKDDKKDMNALMYKEKKFNQRLKEKYNSERKYKKSNKSASAVLDGGIDYDEIVDTNIETKSNVSGDVEFEDIKVVEVQRTNIIETDFTYENIDIKETTKSNFISDDGNFKYEEVNYPATTDKEFERIELYSKLNALINNYKLVRTNKYENNVIINIKNLIINIPRYIHNKKAVARMEKDYSKYYQGRDLFRLIRYSKYDNSFIYAIGDIFKSKNLEVERAKKYRKLIESIYNNRVVEKSRPEDFKYHRLKKVSA